MQISHLRTALCRRAPIIGALTISSLALGQQQSPVKEDVGVQPQIDIAGSGVATLDIGKRGMFGSRGLSSGSQINFSDSALLLGASQRLYRGALGSFTLGGLTTDQSNFGKGTQAFLHQGFLDFQSERFETYLGRTNNPTTQLVNFPTIREDDLNPYTTVLNPFSNGENQEEHRYSNVASVVFNQKLRYFENVHVQHLIDSATGSSGTGINSAGASIQYLAPPTVEPLTRVVSYGAGFEHRTIDREFGGNSDVIYAGGTFNLKPSMTNRVDLRLFGTYSFGNDTNTFNTITDTYRADSSSIAASIRLLQTPFGTPGQQLSLTAGYRNYRKVGSANSFGTALTYVRRLGPGFDAVAQVNYERRSDALAAMFGGQRDSTTLQLGLVFNFNSTFNQSVGPRRSPLNLLHKYIPN